MALRSRAFTDLFYLENAIETSLPFARDLLRNGAQLARMRARPRAWSLALYRSRGG
jgi:hypothetical protein